MNFYCRQCDRAWDGDEEWFNLEHRNQDTRLCSPACVMEYAWKLREAQPKLSKSWQEQLDAPDPWAGPNWIGKRVDE